MKCSKCGSREIYTRTTGHPDTKGSEKAICGRCGHKATLRKWDNTKQVNYSLDYNESKECEI